MNYRIGKQGLLDTLGAWNGFMRKRVRLIACGGTALTLLDVKASTKDIDLLVPETAEYEYLIGILRDLGYKSASGSGWARDGGFIFDLFRGKRVHSTELLSSPLESGNNMPVKEFSRIYLGALNYYDLMISKLFRGSGVDMEDCLMLMKARGREIDIGALKERFRETASYDVAEAVVNKNLDHFVKLLKKEGFRI